MFDGGNKEETRNLILAAVLSMAVVFAWLAIFPPEPEPPARQPVAEGGAGGVAGGAGQSVEAGPRVALDRDGALAQAERVEIRSDAVWGSIALKGGRIDDLHLSDYNVTLDRESDTVTLLNPVGGPNPYYAVYGWLPTAGSDPGPLPGPNTPWRLVEGDVLAPDQPVTLEWDNGEGMVFRRTYALDRRYMFSLAQSVENARDEAVSLAPYGYIARRGTPETTPFFILHEGVVAMLDGELTELSYGDLVDLPPSPRERGRVQSVAVGEGGWLGFTDKYWMTTLVPEPGTAFEAVYKAIPGERIEYRTEMRLPVQTVAAGDTAISTTRLFAGAKELDTISDYESDLGIVNFVDAIDWGWFYFLTKPVAWLLVFIQGLIGNMGFSIIILTLIVKAALFPLAYKSYVAMSKMKKLQPEMEKIKERAGDDRMKLQQEMMALYKKEKVNPAAGCLPILVQIPIFFALYKVLFVTIEMRHAPFILWIDDLSAPDPTSWLNLFGLLPYDVSWAPVFISIGVFPILMGITMWMQQKLNPAPTDPTQQMIFAWMPWLFMFMLGSFASGLVIYWTANNVLTFAQQYAIMRSQGVDVDFFGNVTKSLKRTRDAVRGKKDEAQDAAEDASTAPFSDTKAAPEPTENGTLPETGAGTAAGTGQGEDDATEAASKPGDPDAPEATETTSAASPRERPTPNRPRKAAGGGRKQAGGGRGKRRR